MEKEKDNESEPQGNDLGYEFADHAVVEITAVGVVVEKGKKEGGENEKGCRNQDEFPRDGGSHD